MTGWLASYFFLTPETVRVQKSIDALLDQSQILATKANQAALKGDTAAAEQCAWPVPSRWPRRRA